ncbi:MAG: cytochrome b N-terminal domain-containing protein [Candidatus Solibacter usitatus]|nr:cytochrome b N-terminal domain-containing protein [Candidatus Solibacter usitatus]
MSALRTFGDDLKAAPKRMWETAFRGGAPNTDRTRSTFVFGNVFLHLHATRTHRWSLRWTTTLGLGMATTAAFLLTLITGILLMFYYKPYPDVAYDSIKDIHFVVPTGRFMRNIHRWAANVMVVCVILHMARTFYTAAYRKPREFNWLIGMGLLVVTLALSFTGYLLPWDQLAYWAITIGANIAQSPREVTDALGITEHFDPGGLQRLLLLGSDVVGAEALIRFYLLHVMILPLALAALMGVHFWRIRKDGGMVKPHDADQRVGPPEVHLNPVFTEEPAKTYQLAALVKGRTKAVGGSPENTVPSMPHLFYAELGVLMLTTLVCLALSMLSDAPLKELANPGVPENPAKAPWYFLGLQELVAFSAVMGGIGVPTIVLIGLGLIPYLDRESRATGVWFGGPGGWPLVKQSIYYGLACSLLVESFVIRFGWLREWFPNIQQLIVTAVNPATIITTLYGAWSVWMVKKHDSARAGALALFTCFLCGFLVLTIIGTYFRGPNWVFYWSPSQWPKH